MIVGDTSVFLSSGVGDVRRPVARENVETLDAGLDEARAVIEDWSVAAVFEDQQGFWSGTEELFSAGVFRESMVSDRLRLAVGAFAFVLLGGLAWVYVIAPEQAGVGTLIDPAFVFIALAVTGFLGFGYFLGERLQSKSGSR